MDLLDKLELCAHADIANKGDSVNNLPKAIPENERSEHCLMSAIQEKKLRSWLGKSDPNLSPETQTREMLRKHAVIRGDRTTGYVGSWLNVVPSQALGTKLEPLVFGKILRWWLGETVSIQGRCPERVTSEGRPCGAGMDTLGDHAVMCAAGSGRIARHDAVNKTWLLTARGAGFQARREVRIDPATQKRHADTFIFDWQGDQSCAQDWVVCHVLTKEGVTRHKTNPDWAVLAAEAEKVRAEKGVCAARGFQFISMGIDTFGGFGEGARKAIARMANEYRMARNEEAAVSSKRIAQKIRVVAMRAIGYQLACRAVAQGAVDDCEEEAEEAAQLAAPGAGSYHTQAEGDELEDQQDTVVLPKDTPGVDRKDVVGESPGQGNTSSFPQHAVVESASEYIDKSQFHEDQCVSNAHVQETATAPPQTVGPPAANRMSLDSSPSRPSVL